MTITSLTINPEEVRAAAGATPAWLEQIAAYVRQAAGGGESVTLTASPRMLTPEQVAQAMGVSRPTISRRIKAGEIRVVKVGNRNRVPYEEFERYWRKTMGDLVAFVRDDLGDELVVEP